MVLTKRQTKSIRFITALLRIAVGAVFIFSGFVKAIDPWGTVYKVNEYLALLGLDYFESLSAFLAFSLAIFEFVLGIFTFTGCYRRTTPILLMLSMVVMLPLTLYIAITDGVTDCGCFGEAVKMSNWETFVKNVVLTIAIGYLMVFNKRLINYYGVAVQWIVLVLSFAFAGAICMDGYFGQPLLDFRPYKIGSHLVAQNDNIEDPEYRFIYKKGGVVQSFHLDSLPGDDWEFVDREVVGGDEELEHNDVSRLQIIEDGEDITADVIKSEGDQIILLFTDLDDVEIPYTFAINEIHDVAQKNGVDFIALTSSDSDAIAQWRELSMATYNIYIIDDSELKQIARGNPAIVYLKDGVIKWKNSLQALSVRQFEKESIDMSMISGEYDLEKRLFSLTILYLGTMLALLVINRTHKVLKIKDYLDRKNQNKSVTLHPEN